jgi:hypothetical protein
MQHASISSRCLSVPLAIGAIFMFWSSALAATDACAPLNSPLVAKALGTANITVGQAFDPRGTGSQYQQAALQGATAAQACVAHDAAIPQTELRATIATFPDVTSFSMALASGRAALMDMSHAAGWKVSTSQTSVAGQEANIVQTDAATIHTYTISASKGNTRYSMSAQAPQRVDAAAMASLLGTLMG